MKEAMWGLGLIMLCLLAFVIIGVVSNVTLTNQQDYYGVKQTSEASAYDSSGTNNIAYRRGICVCANEGTSKDASGSYVISKRTQYTITEPDDNNECESKERCELRLGEYVIDPKMFNENIIVRLGSIIKASEVYDIKVQEIIPYPPKISVYISYHQALNVEGEDTINSEIPNKFDGIFEDSGKQSVLTYADNNLPDWLFSCGTPETKTYCYYDKDGNVSSNKWRFCPELTDESKCTAAGYEEKIQVSDTSKCVDVCVCKNGKSCVMAANVNWGGGWTVESNDKCGEPEKPKPSGSNCTWHYYSSYVTCGKYGSDQEVSPSAACPTNCTGTPSYGSSGGKVVKTCTKCKVSQGKGSISSGRNTSASSSAAVQACTTAASNKCSGWSWNSNDCKAVRDYKCYYDGKNAQGKMTTLSEEKKNQESDPTSSFCAGKSNCYCDCLG